MQGTGAGGCLLLGYWAFPTTLNLPPQWPTRGPVILSWHRTDEHPRLADAVACRKAYAVAGPQTAQVSWPASSHCFFPKHSLNRPWFSSWVTFWWRMARGGIKRVILENDSGHKLSHVLRGLYVCSNSPCLASKKIKFHTHTPFWGERKKTGKIAGNVISSQTGRSLGSGLKVPRAITEPIRKASDFHLLHFLQNYHPEPYPSAT